MRDGFDLENENGAPEETLRLVAELPPPEGIEERVHLRLERGMEPELTASSRRGFWGLWLPSHRLQFAGAAVLVLAFAGSTWSVHHARSSAAAPVVQPAPPGPAFGSAGAERHPSTLKPIKVPPPAPKKKKPSASRVAPKHAAKSTDATEQGNLNTPPAQ